MKRSRVIAGLALLAIVAATAYVVSRPPGITGGPLQPSDNVNGFGHHVAPGGVASFVIQPRAAEPVTVMVNQLTLDGQTAGLEVLGSGVLRGPFPGYLVDGYSPDAIDPLIGTTRTFTPTQDAPFLVIGLRAPGVDMSYSATGVWLDYTLNGRHYRALLPWQMTLCTTVGELCNAPDGMMFSLPPP
jgi:hypothetical protein